MTDFKLTDEPGRLAALRRYDLLDSAPESSFDRITALVKTVLDVPIAVISLVDTGRLWFKSVQGGGGDAIPRDTSFCHHTIQSRTPMIVPDVADDPRFVDLPAVTGPPHIRSYIGVPLETPDHYNIGSLCAMDILPRVFRPEQIDLLQRFAALVSNELELRSIALTDQLTGAVSRRALLQEAERIVARFGRAQNPAALVVFDLDHFKQVNDRYGHAVGDIVLRSTAACCLGLIRESDIFGRLGGEEFALLLPDAGLETALTVAERIRAALEGLLIPAEPAIEITGSFGISALSAAFTSAAEWLQAADTAMYEAKRSGRNRVSGVRQARRVKSM
ncbi:MAG: diguanylate cyclase [Rhodospirillales bacterium 20-64-7]|nr:MAG: diguanylate cyclase [Rhodospirillales bacterium 20-64-7]